MADTQNLAVESGGHRVYPSTVATSVSFNGNKTVDIEPITIATNGNSMKPLENSANTSLPKYRLMKNWLDEAIIIPHNEAYNNGKENANISR